MEPEFWLERWQNNEIGFHQAEINAHLRDYWAQMGIPPGGLVFVPLCGRSHDMMWLRTQGYRVLGVELSPIAVQDFYAENRLQAQMKSGPKFDRWEADGLMLLRGDLFDLAAGDLTDVAAVYDRASLVAFPPEMREQYVRKLASVLPPATRMLLVVMDYPKQQMSGPPFPVSEREVRALYEPGNRVELLHTRDILDENPRFRTRGLTRLSEQAFHIRPGA
ncbi:MAG: thiopurine S-methyltransferase [Acidiferrobacterales bacterium]